MFVGTNAHWRRLSHKLSWVCRYNILRATNNTEKQGAPSANGNAEDCWRGEARCLKIVGSERVVFGDPYLAAKYSFSLLMLHGRHKQQGKRVAPARRQQ